jgi:hypothetical protein
VVGSDRQNAAAAYWQSKFSAPRSEKNDGNCNYRTMTSFSTNYKTRRGPSRTIAIIVHKRLSAAIFLNCLLLVLQLVEKKVIVLELMCKQSVSVKFYVTVAIVIGVTIA